MKFHRIRYKVSVDVAAPNAEEFRKALDLGDMKLRVEPQGSAMAFIDRYIEENPYDEPRDSPEVKKYVALKKILQEKYSEFYMIRYGDLPDHSHYI